MNIIETQQLTKFYGKSRGIIGVTMEVKEGEIFGFIGPNGAGKSTTIRTLLSLIYPTSGSAKIFGKDCITEGHLIRESIGYLPSEVFYYENMKVKDLLNYSASFYNKDSSHRIKYLSDYMELDLNRKIDDLSYGNKKKVGIVQGLLHEPKLIILDEPTTGLDPLMQHKFFELIQEENKKGATVFFSSHILNEVQKMCSRVAIIKEGQIIRTDDIQTLREENYKRFKLEGLKPEFDGEFIQSGASNIHRNQDEVEFMFKGDINKMIKLLGEHTITNLIVEELSLEEIFMHYYSKEV